MVSSPQHRLAQWLSKLLDPVFMFNEEFQAFSALILEPKGELLLLGDFNINFSEKQDLNALNFLKILQENNLKQLVMAPTHFKGGTLDLVIMNQNLE